jgi:nucleoside phosphorylase
LIDAHAQAIVLASGGPAQAAAVSSGLRKLIIIFYAFGREVGTLKRRFETRRALREAGLSGICGTLAGAEVTAIATGMGNRRARECARRAFDKFPHPELAISTGVAGALSQGLMPGDLVIADRLIAAASADPDRPEQIVPDARHTRSVQQALRTAGLSFSTGALLTSRRALTTAAEKRDAKSRTGAIAVDMESAIVADQARSRNIPFACVRAILDTADEELLGAELADEDGRVQPLKAAGFVIRHPGAILKLPRIARNLGIAAKSLADALEAIIRQEALSKPAAASPADS